MSAVDQSAIDRKRDQQRRDGITRQIVIRTLMSTADGRRYIWLQLSESNVFSSTFTWEGGEGFARTAFLEGQRALGIKLLTLVTQLCPAEYITMTRENGMKETGNDNRTSGTSGGTSDLLEPGPDPSSGD
jgi:hypothetical protein